MRVALYLRVSTKEQTADPQQIELSNWCNLHQHTITHVYRDVMSGGRRDRPMLNQMLEDAKAKPFDCVMCVKIDRLARSMRDFINITQLLDDRGIALIVPGQGIDTSDQSPCGKLMRQLLAAVAEFERGIIKERVNAGIAAAKQNGVKFGKPSKKLHPDWRNIIKSWNEINYGLGGYRELAKLLGGVSVSTAYQLAKQCI